MKFELVFFGGVSIKYKRKHDTVESAKAEAKRVLNCIVNAAAHPPIIYGVGLPESGIRV